MSGKSSLAVFALLALIVAHLWQQETSTKAGVVEYLVKNWKVLGLELVGVVAVAFVAEVSDAAATIVLVLAAGLWLLFAVNVWGAHKAAPQKSPAKPPASHPKAA